MCLWLVYRYVQLIVNVNEDLNVTGNPDFKNLAGYTDAAVPLRPNSPQLSITTKVSRLSVVNINNLE